MIYFDKKHNTYLDKSQIAEEDIVFSCEDSVWGDFNNNPDKYVWKNDKLIVRPEWEEEQAQAGEDAFNQEFFLTSLGYIRRKVAMANGETKDFLSDLLPTIAMGSQLGQAVSILCYNKPDFTQEVINWEEYQHAEVATPQFIQECFMQLSLDFTGVQNPPNEMGEDPEETEDPDSSQDETEELPQIEAEEIESEVEDV